MEIKQEHIIQQEPISGITFYWDGITNSLCLKNVAENMSMPYTAKRLVYTVEAFAEMSRQITQAVAKFTERVTFIKEVR